MGKRLGHVFLCLITCIMFCIVFYILWVNTKDDDLLLESKLISHTKDEFVVDFYLTNNSNKTLYNIELLTECEEPGYTNNSVTQGALEASADLHMRAVYENTGAAHKYSVREVYAARVLVIFIAYLACMLLAAYFAITDHKVRNVLVLLIMLVADTVVVMHLIDVKKPCKNDRLIHTYEDTLEFKVGDEPVRVHVMANYTLSSLEQLVDKNNNGIPTVAEKEDLVTDTDGDGIPDYYELYLCNTNPFMLDTGGTGLGDCNKDSDSDGLSNLVEVKLGSNPINTDTDYDGLEDKDELSLGTDILNWDTDGDNMSDGFEVEQGYDPLIANNKVVITKELLSEGKHSEDTIKARVEVNTDASNAESLAIHEYSTVLLNESMPGYIGSAFEFKIDGDIDSAKLSFELDESWLMRKEYDPCIYYFNEETQLLEELETEIDGNVLSTTVSHFSVYVVLNRIEVDKWMYVDMFEKSFSDHRTSDGWNYISFVVDNSNSMASSDPDNEVKSLIEDFVSKIDTTDYVSFVHFTRTGIVDCEFTTDYEALLDYSYTLSRDTGNNIDSDTDIMSGLQKSLDLFDNKTLSGKKFILLFTDGDTIKKLFDKEMITSRASKLGVRIYCIDLGMLEHDRLKYICNHTGGKYYKVNDTVIEELAEDFKDISYEIKESDKGIGDGLTNYEKSLIESGVLRTGTGISLFDGMNFSLWRGNPDVDADGLLNGEEISVEAVNGHVYIKLKSDPFKKDTDGDGIGDKIDTAPFVLGLAGGIIGSMTLAADCTSIMDIPFPAIHSDIFSRNKAIIDAEEEKKHEVKSIESGHSWLIFNNNCNMTLDDTNFMEGHYKVVYDWITRFVTYHDLYPFTLDVNTYTSFGYYGMGREGVLENKGLTRWDDGLSPEEIGHKVKEQADMQTYTADMTDEEKLEKYDVSMKLEDALYSDFRINEEFYKMFIHGANYYDNAASMSMVIDADQWERFVEYVDQAPIYTICGYNCTNFAIEAWNSMCIENRDKVQYDPLVFGIPTSLHREILRRYPKNYRFEILMKSYLDQMKPMYWYIHGELVEEYDT